MKLSGLQKDVLALYRSALRAVRDKPEASRARFKAFARAEFDKNIGINKRDFTAIEYLLRKGRRQVETFSSPGIMDIINSHHFPKLGFKLGSSSSPASRKDAAAAAASGSPSSPTTAGAVAAAVAARKRQSVHHLHHLPLPLASSSAAKLRPHQRNVIRKRRRSRVRVSFSRSSTSAASSAASRARKAKTRRPDKKKPAAASDGGGQSQGPGSGKARGLHTWVARHIRSSPKDGAAALAHKPMEISHPIPLLLPSRDNPAPAGPRTLGPSHPQRGRYSLMQVPEQTFDPIPGVSMPIAAVRFLDHAAISPTPEYLPEYAHVGPIDLGLDGATPADDATHQPPPPRQILISRRPVASPPKAGDPTPRRGREHVAVVSSLTTKQNKRFGLADPIVWSSVSRTLSQQHRLSAMVSPERSAKSSSILVEAPARTSSQQKKLNRFTKELERYHAAHPNPPPSSTQELPSSDSLKTVSVLVPYQSEFTAAGLAVTSTQQRERSPPKFQHRAVIREAPVAAATHFSGSTIDSQLDGSVQSPQEVSSVGSDSSSRSGFRPPPPEEIPVLLAETVFPDTPDKRDSSPRKVLPWLCNRQAESSPSEDNHDWEKLAMLTQAVPLEGPRSSIPPAVRISMERRASRRGQGVDYTHGQTRTSVGSGWSPRITQVTVPPIPPKSASRPVDGSSQKLVQLKMSTPSPEKKHQAVASEKGLRVHYTDALATPPPQDSPHPIVNSGVTSTKRVQATDSGSPTMSEIPRPLRISRPPRVTTFRQHPSTITEEAESTASSCSSVNVNKPLPRTPPEIQEQRLSWSAETGNEAVSQNKRTPSPKKEISPNTPGEDLNKTNHAQRASTTSPPKLPHTWKYAIITDSSFEEALDAVVHRLEKLDDTTTAAKPGPTPPSETPKQRKQRETPPATIIPALVSELRRPPTPMPDIQRTPTQKPEPQGIPTQVPEHQHTPAQNRTPGTPPLISITEPTPNSQAAKKRAAKEKRVVVNSPSPIAVRFPSPTSGSASDREDHQEPKPKQEKKEVAANPEDADSDWEDTPAAEEHVDRHDRDISDRDVLKGLRLAIEAACDEDFDAWIRDKTGLRLRRFMADLRGFEGLREEAAVTGTIGGGGGSGGADDEQAARRRRAEKRRVEAARHWRRSRKGC